MGTGLEQQDGGKLAKGKASGKPVCASNTLGRREVMSRLVEVMGRVTSEAIKVMSMHFAGWNLL